MTDSSDIGVDDILGEDYSPEEVEALEVNGLDQQKARMAWENIVKLGGNGTISGPRNDYDCCFDCDLGMKERHVVIDIFPKGLDSRARQRFENSSNNSVMLVLDKDGRFRIFDNNYRKSGRGLFSPKEVNALMANIASIEEIEDSGAAADVVADTKDQIDAQL